MLFFKKTTLSLIAATFLLASCNGVVAEETFNVYFFTANSGATQVDTIFDQPVGETIGQPEDPLRNGFDFAGWYLDFNKTIPWDFEEDVMPEGSIVLYADWAPTIRDIIYNLNGGTMNVENYPTTFVPGQSFVLPQARRTGYQFRGWFLYEQILANFPNNEGTRPGDQGITSISANQFEDVILFAHWSAIKAVVTFRPSHPDGTSVVPNPSNRVVAYGTVINYGTNFPADYGIVNGYVFLGWNSRVNGTGDWYANDAIFIRTLAITLYGQWQPV